MIQFEDIMKLKVGDTVVCCEKVPPIISYEPGELYVIIAINGDDMELRPVWEDKNFSFEKVSYDDMYKHFMIPDENDFYIGDLGVIKYDDELYFIYVKSIQLNDIWDFDNIHNQRKYKTGDKVFCEMCPNMYDVSEVISFGWVDKSKLIKIQRNFTDQSQVKIEPGMNVLIDIDGSYFFEHLDQIEIPNGLVTAYVTHDSSGKVYRRKKSDIAIPKSKFSLGSKIISINNTRFMVIAISEFCGLANVGYQYSYDVVGLNFSAAGEMEIYKHIPEIEMNDIYGYLTNKQRHIENNINNK